MSKRRQNDISSRQIFLRPHGAGFSDCVDEKASDNADISSKTEDCGKEFLNLYSYGRGDERTERRERRLISKVRFIKELAPEDTTKELLLHLLADQNTLFSNAYQVYASDHGIYKTTREEWGTTPESQRAYAAEFAVRGKPEKYKKLLMELQQTAVSKHKSVGYFKEEIYKEAWIRREPQFTANDLIPYCRDREAFSLLRKYVPELNLTDACCEEQFLAHIPKLLEKFNIALNGDKVLGQLRRWVNDVPLTPDEAVYFTEEVLGVYCEKERQQSALRRAAGNFRASHVGENKYRTRLKRLTDTRKASESSHWKAIRHDILPWEVKVCGSIEMDAPNLDGIFEATEKYFGQVSRSRGSSIPIKRAAVSEVIFQLCGDDDFSLFPFKYLMVCIAGGSEIFRYSWNISLEAFHESTELPYSKKPSRRRQRTARLRLLHDLCDICKLSPEQESENWRAFLQYHKPDIESEDEESLWHEILGITSADELWDKEPFVNIPEICFRFLCRAAVQNCISAEPETLFCYLPETHLYNGAFAEFLKRHPDALESCIRSIRHCRELLNKYLSCWSAEKYYLPEIRAFCEQKASRLHWSKIDGASTEKLRVFCRSTVPALAENDSLCSTAVKELRALLVELSMRTVLADQARNLLKEKFKSCYGISL